MEPTTIIKIFTDGSAEKKPNGRLGCGMFCEYVGSEYRSSIYCTRDVLASYGIPKSQSCSNPTAEFVACVEVLKMLKDTPKGYHIQFWIDYEGVMCWTNGTYQAKQPHIKLILAAYKKLVAKMKCEVSVEWVKGHATSYGNKQADIQAGLYSTDTTEFEEFADILV